MPYRPCLLKESPCCEGRRKFIVRNNDFVWFFKLGLMIVEFYNGFSLRFSIEEVVRLRGVLSEVFRFMGNYQVLMSRLDKTDY